jgi:hypothetical protein
MGSYDPQSARLAVSGRVAKLTKSHRLMTLWKLYVYDPIFEGLAQDLQDVATALRQFI